MRGRRGIIPLPPGSSSSDGKTDRFIFDFSQPEKNETAFWFSGRKEGRAEGEGDLLRMAKTVEKKET